jgi:diguanylate cyclase (GGDEF)-like protein
MIVAAQPNARELATASQAVALLSAQADGLRAEIATLRQELAELQRNGRKAQATELVEANSQLVLSALHAEEVAETAVSELDELTQSSQRDALTGMPNRALMLDRLGGAIAMARRHGTRAALLFLDLDGFKLINDSLGHAAGDEVLRLVAQRLASVLRDSDAVSRHSGDEFLVLLTEVAHATHASLGATKILRAIAEPITVGGEMLHLSASVGIAIYPEDGDDAATLINHADVAMYRSKRGGCGGFAFYGEELLSSGTVASAPSNWKGGGQGRA